MVHINRSEFHMAVKRAMFSVFTRTLLLDLVKSSVVPKKNVKRKIMCPLKWPYCMRFPPAYTQINITKPTYVCIAYRRQF